LREESIHNEYELLQQVAQGSESAFRELYNRHHQRIYSFALFITHSDVLAEEVTQEIFIKVWTHRTELEGIRNFNAWLKTLVRNQAYTYLSRQAKERIILQEIGQSSPHSSNDTEITVLDQEYNRLLQEAINGLPRQQQKVYLLSRQQGLKHEEIAQELGLSVNTVKNHMKAALQHIKQFLNGRTDAILALALALFFYD
jgi:RNA polymerase sigma-70 factor (ECF subfamily)